MRRGGEKLKSLGKKSRQLVGSVLHPSSLLLLSFTLCLSESDISMLEAGSWSWIWILFLMKLLAQTRIQTGNRQTGKHSNGGGMILWDQKITIDKTPQTSRTQTIHQATFDELKGNAGLQVLSWKTGMWGRVCERELVKWSGCVACVEVTSVTLASFVGQCVLSLTKICCLFHGEVQLFISLV